MKNPIVAGAIAGIIDNLAFYLGTYQLSLILGIMSVPTAIQTTEMIIIQFTSHLTLNLIWGIAFGIVFATFYNQIPGKGILKGVIFGLTFYFLLSNVRISSFLGSYAEFYWTKIFLYFGFLHGIIYGLAIGYLYKK